MKRQRVLLVDDDVDNLDMLKVLLGEAYEVRGFMTAQAALATLEAVQPTVVVLDIGMRPVDGLECLAAIRTTPGFEGIPAIALTAYARDAEQEKFLAAGFDVVVTKPVFDEHELFGAIERALALRDVSGRIPSHGENRDTPGLRRSG